MHGPEILEFHIRRVANDGIKAATLEHNWKSVLPIEGVYALFFSLVIESEIDLALEEVRTD
jgi:hypothetical protein